MLRNNTIGLQSSDTEPQLQQVLSHLHNQTLDEPACQVCDDLLREGDQITLYLSKPAGSGRYKIDLFRCHRHDDHLSSLFTLDVEELIIDGRVGQCRDGATQQTWAILLSPSVRLISASDTTTGRDPTDFTTTDTSEWNYGQQLRERAEHNHTSTDRLQTDQTENQIGGRQ